MIFQLSTPLMKLNIPLFSVMFKSEKEMTTVASSLWVMSGQTEEKTLLGAEV